VRNAIPLASASAVADGSPAKIASTADSACARDHQISSIGTPSL
jgi:hypothetical protein